SGHVYNQSFLDYRVLKAKSESEFVCFFCLPFFWPAGAAFACAVAGAAGRAGYSLISAEGFAAGVAVGWLQGPPAPPLLSSCTPASTELLLVPSGLRLNLTTA